MGFRWRTRLGGLKNIGEYSWGHTGFSLSDSSLQVQTDWFPSRWQVDSYGVTLGFPTQRACWTDPCRRKPENAT